MRPVSDYEDAPLKPTSGPITIREVPSRHIEEASIFPSSLPGQSDFFIASSVRLDFEVGQLHEYWSVGMPFRSRFSGGQARRIVMAVIGGVQTINEAGFRRCNNCACSRFHFAHDWPPRVGLFVSLSSD